MGKRSRWIAIGSAVVAVTLLAWAFVPRPLPVELAPVSTGAFEATVDEDARTRVRDRFVVVAPLAGTLARITLREGDEVAIGAPLARLDPLPPALLDRRTSMAQRAAVGVAEAGLERADARIAEADVVLAQARSRLSRSERLLVDRLVPAATVETDRLALRAAQRQADAAVAERHMSLHALEQARAALEAAAGEPGATFEVRSPVAGRVLRVLQQSEAAVGLGTPLLEIGDTAALEIVAEVLTTEAVRVLPGQRVHVEGWGGDRVLEGTVNRVEPGAFTKISALGVEEQRVRVVIDLQGSPGHWQRLGDGFRVSVRIVTDAADQALRVPLGALFPRPEGGMAVFVHEDGRVALRDIRLRARGATHAWVESGVEAGEELVVFPPAELTDGQRVRRRE